METAAARLRAKLGVSQVVVHPTAFAVAASGDGVFSVAGTRVAKPKLTTGGGDNFNAGYCHGLLAGLSPQGALLCGVTWSGYYVRNGTSPSREQAMTDLSPLGRKGPLL